jgi:hypothetical protein
MAISGSAIWMPRRRQKYTSTAWTLLKCKSTVLNLPEMPGHLLKYQSTFSNFATISAKCLAICWKVSPHAAHVTALFAAAWPFDEIYICHLQICRSINPQLRHLWKSKFLVNFFSANIQALSRDWIYVSANVHSLKSLSSHHSLNLLNALHCICILLSWPMATFQIFLIFLYFILCIFIISWLTLIH